MKNILRQLIFFCCFIPALLWAQDVEVKRERTFPTTAIYGYMNGGTDQYLEYGVQKLTVSEIVYKGEDYTVEVFEMPSPEDAFGIYSLHVFKCDRIDILSGINCLSPYQLQTACGNKYISIVFPSGSDSARIYSDELLLHYIPDYLEQKTSIPILSILENSVSGNVKYIKGPLGLSKTDFGLADLLKNITYSHIWYFSDKAKKTYIAMISMEKHDELKTLKNRIPSDNILETGENYLLIKGNEKEEVKEDLGNFGF